MMDEIRALPGAAQRWYVVVVVSAAATVIASLLLSPIQVLWWQALVLGLGSSLLTILTDPALTSRHARERVTTSHGVIIGYVVLSVAGPASALIVYAVQYSLVLLVQRWKGQAPAIHKWWFNQGALVLSTVGAWLVLQPWGLPLELTTLLMPLAANAINAGIVVVMVARARGQSITANLLTNWRQLVWANADSTLVAHYAGLVWLHLPWLAVTVPMLIITRGQLAKVVNQMVDRAAIEAELARRDGLTGLQNRRSLDQVLARLNGDQAAAAILMIDLDRFKSINDTAGHLAGDDVLRAVADRVRQQVRPIDTVGRFGGEELCVIARGLHGRDEAEQLGERLRAAVEELVIDTVTTDGKAVAVRATVSIGIGMWRTGLEPTMVLQAADRAMYRAKDGGRNQVRFAE